MVNKLAGLPLKEGQVQPKPSDRQSGSLTMILLDRQEDPSQKVRRSMSVVKLVCEHYNPE